MKTVVKKTLKIAGIILLSLLVLILVLASSNLFVTASEEKEFPASGVLVDVNGKKMHIYTQGEGQARIVILPGLGITSPVYDFGPLVAEVKNDFSVTVVEPLGYGWSEGTNEKRDVRQIVEEIREGLKQADILPPYILVPHSISGLYAQYYAATYPEEIQGIVGLDSCVPNQTVKDPMPSGFSLFAFLRNLGLGRIIFAVAPDMMGYPHSDYSPDQIKMINMFALWNMDNQSILNETLAIHENSVFLTDLKIPKGIPVCFLLADQSVEHFATVGMDWEKEHESIAEDRSDVSVSVLAGGHCLYWTASRPIADQIKEFVDGLDLE